MRGVCTMKLLQRRFYKALLVLVQPPSFQVGIFVMTPSCPFVPMLWSLPVMLFLRLLLRTWMLWAILPFFIIWCILMLKPYLTWSLSPDAFKTLIRWSRLMPVSLQVRQNTSIRLHSLRKKTTSLAKIITSWYHQNGYRGYAIDLRRKSGFLMKWRNSVNLDLKSPSVENTETKF